MTQVTIVCPGCSGFGQIQYYDEFDHDCWRVCDGCGGDGHCTEEMTASPELREVIGPARVFMEHFVPVEEALINGFDVDVWCAKVDELSLPLEML